jgi:hypothetical protein
MHNPTCFSSNYTVNSTYPRVGYVDRQIVENSTKLSCLEITGYWMKYSTVLWLIELQIRRGRKV